MALSRKNLLDPVLAENEVWAILFDCIDKVWDESGISSAIRNLKHLRTPYTYSDNPNTESLYTVSSDSAGVLVHERQTLLSMLSMLGFDTSICSDFSDEELVRLVCFTAQHRNQSLGTQNNDNFLSYVLDSIFAMYPTWTKDYVEFLKEGDENIGTPVYLGGEWYPTTHVVLKYDVTRFPEIRKALEVAYSTSGINIVVESVEPTLPIKVTFDVAVSASITIVV